MYIQPKMSYYLYPYTQRVNIKAAVRLPQSPSRDFVRFWCARCEVQNFVSSKLAIYRVITKNISESTCGKSRLLFI